MRAFGRSHRVPGADLARDATRYAFGTEKKNRCFRIFREERKIKSRSA